MSVSIANLKFQNAADYYDFCLARFIKGAFSRSTGNNLAVTDSLLRTIKVIVRITFDPEFLTNLRERESPDDKTSEAAQKLSQCLAATNINNAGHRNIPTNAIDLIVKLMEASTPELKCSRQTTFKTHLDVLVNAGFLNVVKGVSKNSTHVYHPTSAFEQAVQWSNRGKTIDFEVYFETYYSGVDNTISDTATDVDPAIVERGDFHIQPNKNNISLSGGRIARAGKQAAMVALASASILSTQAAKAETSTLNQMEVHSEIYTENTLMVEVVAPNYQHNSEQYLLEMNYPFVGQNFQGFFPEIGNLSDAYNILQVDAGDATDYFGWNGQKPPLLPILPSNIGSGLSL